MIQNISFKTIACASILLLNASAWSVGIPDEETETTQTSRPATQNAPVVEEIKQETQTARIGQILDNFPTFGVIKDETKSGGYLMKNHPSEAQGNALYFDQDPQNQGILYANLDSGEKMYFKNDNGQLRTFTRGANEGNGTVAKKASGDLNPDRDYSQKSQFVQNRDRVVNNFKKLF